MEVSVVRFGSENDVDVDDVECAFEFESDLSELPAQLIDLAKKLTSIVAEHQRKENPLQKMCLLRVTVGISDELTLDYDPDEETGFGKPKM